MLQLDELLDTPPPATTKGLAPAAAGRPLREIGGLGLSVLQGDLPWPAALLRRSALEHNARWMRDFVARAGVALCPHGKTTMSPQLFDRQLRDGCWGITLATASQVRACRSFGVRRILLANQLVGRADIAIVLDELRRDPAFELLVLVDSEAGLSLLTSALQAAPIGRPLPVLLEVGTPGGRTGVRSVEAGLALGRRLRAAAPWVALRGVEAFEGIVGGDDHARVELTVHQMLDTVVELARHGAAEDWFAPDEIILSAGGSACFDLAAGRLSQAGLDGRARVVLRSGCYLTHDVLFYARLQQRMRERAGAMWGTGPGLRNALEVWAPVQSVPEDGRAICALGKRDVSFDMALPKPLWWYRPGLHDAPAKAPDDWRVVALNDQHAWLDAQSPAAPPQVGDLIGFGIGHPCTTFDRWTLLHVVDDDLRVVDAVRTFF